MSVVTQTKPLAGQARDRCLDAAEHLVVRAGASHVTLDAVAKAARVSKGGLLYHFPSKEALLEGMIERHLCELDACTEVSGEGVGPLEAHIHALLEARRPRSVACAALLAASATNPELLAICRRHQAKVLEPFERVPSLFAQAALLLLAAYGICFGQAMSVSPLTLEQSKRVVKALSRQARACDSRLTEKSQECRVLSTVAN